MSQAQSQAELKKMVIDLFPDSSDEEDDDNSDVESKETTVKQSATSAKTIAEDDLFNSDDEDEDKEEEHIGRRLNKGPIAKKRERSDESRDSKSEGMKKNRLSRAGSSSSSSTVRPSNGEPHDSSDEYDSGDEVVRTKDDDQFLDNADDDDDLLDDYNRDTQNFDDERPEGSGGPTGGRSVGSAKRVNGGGGIGLIDPNTSNPFEQTLLTLKRSKAVEVTDSKKGEIASEILSTMNNAAIEDQDLYRQGLPAIKKLQMLARMERAVTTKSLQATLLDYDLLSVLKTWIEPMSKTVLAALTVRTAVYDVLKKLPCQTDQVKRSQIGKTLMTLVKHKQETNENKRKIREIIDKWSRPIFGKSIDARNIDNRERFMHETSAEKQHRASMTGKATSSSRSEKSSEQFELKAGEKEEFDDGRSRARMPLSHGLMFTVQPQSREGVAGDGKSGGGGGAKAQRDMGSRNNFVKHLKSMKQSSGKKNFRLVSADVGGRDKA